MKKVLSVLLAVVLCFGVFSVAAFAEGENIQLKLNAPSKAKMGETITVTVSLENNSGYAGLNYQLNFDSTQLQLVSAEFGTDFAGDGEQAGMLGMFSEDKTRAASLVLPATADGTGVTTKTGTLATYKFKVLANGVAATETTKVNLSLQVTQAIDANLKDLTANAPAATVEVEYVEKQILLGDVNGDGVVNAKDVTYLKRYNAKWSGYSVDLSVGDVNKDGSINAKDVTFLKRCNAKWAGYTLE